MRLGRVGALRAFLAGLGAVALLVAGQPGAASPTLPAAAQCAGVWHPVTTPNVGLDNNRLYGVTALAPNEVWAVGQHTNSLGVNTAMIEHFNGRAWSVTSSSNPQFATSTLNAVTAVSPKDVWGVGYYTDSNSKFHSLLVHWNGTKWSVSLIPDVGDSDTLSAASASASDDVWAVGRTQINGVFSTLTEHWDGTTWTPVSAPNPGTGYSDLQGVSAHFADNAWAVGRSYNSDELVDHALVEFWDGHQWSTVATPSNTVAQDLHGLSERTSHDVWAVGDSNDGKHPSRTLAMHWNGSVWKVAPTPNANTTEEHTLWGVWASASDDVWAVGDRFTPGQQVDGKTLAVHWNGSGWKLASTPNFLGGQNALYAVSGDSSKDVWAVGFHTDSHNRDRTLVEHFCKK